jgi:hypothetical protein
MSASITVSSSIATGTVVVGATVATTEVVDADDDTTDDDTVDVGSGVAVVDGADEFRDGYAAAG